MDDPWKGADPATGFVPDDQFVSEIEAKTYCHTCGQPYTGKECGERQLHRRIERFRNTPRESADPDAWTESHAGTCTAGVAPCGEPARLYPTGWRCDDHRPAQVAT